MKRAYHGDSNTFATSSAVSSRHEPEIQESCQMEAGKKLRSFLWSSHLSSRTVDATFLAELSWHITSAGGRGVEDLGVPPESKAGAKHIKLLLGQNFADPTLYYVKTPLHDKITSQRVQTSVPIHLPSQIFEEQLESHDSHVDTNDTQTPTHVHDLDCRKWREHPVRQRHAHILPSSRIRPVALYWDGVQYTERDNFFGLFIRDLLTGVSHLMVVVRWHLSL